MFIKGIAIFLSSCRNVGAELIISKRATQSYFWVTLFEVPGGFEPPYTVLQTAD